jgi:hypothetical protein
MTLDDLGRHRTQQESNVHLLYAQRRLTRFDLRDVEQVLDQTLELLRSLVDRGESFARFSYGRGFDPLQ